MRRGVQLLARYRSPELATLINVLCGPPVTTRSRTTAPISSPSCSPACRASFDGGDSA